MDAVGVAGSDARVRQGHRPAKRVRSSHTGSDAFATPLAARPRGTGMLQNGLVQLQTLEAKALTAGASFSIPGSETQAPTVPVLNTGLQTSQAHHEPWLHGTDMGNHHASAIQYHRPGPVVGSSGDGPGAMSIACVQPPIGNYFAPVASLPSPSNGTVGQAYNPTSQDQQQWSSPNHPDAISGQPHFQASLQAYAQPHSQPQSVPPHFVSVDAAGYPYGHFFPLHFQGLGAEHADRLSTDADIVTPGQETHTFPTYIFGCGQQPPAGPEEDPGLHYPQTPQTFFQAHQGSQCFEASASSFQAVAEPGLPPAALSYTTTPQFGQELRDDEFHYSHKKPHKAGPGLYFQIPMGEGQFIAGQQQALGNGNYSPPIDHPQDVNYMTQGYTIDEATEGQATHPNLEIHSYSQMSDDGSTESHDQANYPRLGVDDCDRSADDETTDVFENADDDNGASSRASLDGSESSTGKRSARTKNKRSRSALSPYHRQQTAETRKIKACTRCRNQKMRCVANPKDPKGTCLGCDKFSKTSKKTLHMTLCFRGKVTDVVLYRCSGLELTRRWTGTEMKDVADRINPEIRTIKFTLGICKDPIVVEVMAFQPRMDDVTARFWTVRDGETEVRKRKDLAEYCLADVHKTADYFEQYVIGNAIGAIMRQRTGPVRLAGRDPALLGAIEKTYLAAIRHFSNLKDEIEVGSNPDLAREKNILGYLFVLWFAIRHTTGSSWICGDETLNMDAETKDETYPLFGKVSVPRMILAQFDSINYTRLLHKYGKKLLTEIEYLLMRNQPRWWYTIYLCLFILLREASWMSEDRYRHARNNYGNKIRYSVPAFVEKLQAGCNNLLQHWHYYNCRPWPDAANPWERHKTFLSELTSEQHDLVMETLTEPALQKQLNFWRRYKENNGQAGKPNEGAQQDHETVYQGSQSQYDWDHPFYWISQLFEEQWRAHPTYQRESIK